MPDDTMKPFLATTTPTLTKPETNNSNSQKLEKSAKFFKNNKNLLIYCLAFVLLLFCIVVSIIMIWNINKVIELEEKIQICNINNVNNKVYQLEEQTAQLKQSVDKMKVLYDDLNEFDNAYPPENEDIEIDAKIAPEEEDGDDDIIFDDEDDDEDYGDGSGYGFLLNEDEDDEGYDDDFDDDDSGENSDSILQDALTAMEKNNSHDKAKQRKTRSITGVTHQGVPILEEPYIPRRNRNRLPPSSPLDEYVTHILIPTQNTINYNKSPKLKLKWDSKQANITREYANRHGNHLKFLNRHHHQQQEQNSQLNTNRFSEFGSMEQRYIKKENQSNVDATKSPTQVYTRTSRVMHTDPRQMTVKDSLKKYHRFMEVRRTPDQYVVNPKRKIIHYPYKKNLETKSHRRPLRLAAHYHGDIHHHNLHHGSHATNKGTTIQLKSDGLIYWKESDWVNTHGMDTYFEMNRGVLTVRESGLYLIYAQIFYVDNRSTVGFKVLHNEKEVFQCTAMTHTETNLTKINTCYTSGLVFLNSNDKIFIRNIHGRDVVLEPFKSFFGLLKIPLTPQHNAFSHDVENFERAKRSQAKN